MHDNEHRPFGALLLQHAEEIRCLCVGNPGTAFAEDLLGIEHQEQRRARPERIVAAAEALVPKRRELPVAVVVVPGRRVERGPEPFTQGVELRPHPQRIIPVGSISVDQVAHRNDKVGGTGAELFGAFAEDVAPLAARAVGNHDKTIRIGEFGKDRKGTSERIAAIRGLPEGKKRKSCQQEQQSFHFNMISDIRQNNRGHGGEKTQPKDPEASVSRATGGAVGEEPAAELQNGSSGTAAVGRQSDGEAANGSERRRTTAAGPRSDDRMTR